MGIVSDILFPPKCVLCGAILARAETDVCKKCRIDAPEYIGGKQKPQFLDSLTSIWYYEDTVRRSLLRYKFYGRRSYAVSYGRMLAAKILAAYPDGFDLITWVPVSRLRRLKRGFDQVELLTKQVAQELGMQPHRLLKKYRHNPPQSHLRDYSHRKANVLGVYRVTDAQCLRGKRILLLDDILTTGATAGECARVLLTAGAKEVHCGVIAVSRKHK